VRGVRGAADVCGCWRAAVGAELRPVTAGLPRGAAVVCFLYVWRALSVADSARRGRAVPLPLPCQRQAPSRCWVTRRRRRRRCRQHGAAPPLLLQPQGLPLLALLRLRLRLGVAARAAPPAHRQQQARRQRPRRQGRRQQGRSSWWAPWTSCYWAAPAPLAAAKPRDRMLVGGRATARPPQQLFLRACVEQRSTRSHTRCCCVQALNAVLLCASLERAAAVRKP
jgi:hypothetical protein